MCDIVLFGWNLFYFWKICDNLELGTILFPSALPSFVGVEHYWYLLSDSYSISKEEDMNQHFFFFFEKGDMNQLGNESLMEILRSLRKGIK